MKITLYLLLALAVLSASFYGYHRYASAKIDAMNLRVEKAEKAAADQAKAMKEFKDDFERQKKLLAQLQKDNQEVDREIGALRRNFRGRNLNQEAKQDRVKAERDVNDSINSAFGRVQSATGGKK